MERNKTVKYGKSVHSGNGFGNGIFGIGEDENGTDTRGAWSDFEPGGSAQLSSSYHHHHQGFADYSNSSLLQLLFASMNEFQPSQSASSLPLLVIVFVGSLCYLSNGFTYPWLLISYRSFNQNHRILPLKYLHEIMASVAFGSLQGTRLPQGACRHGSWHGNWIL